MPPKVRKIMYKLLEPYGRWRSYTRWRNADVYICSYPKSGRTWVRHFLQRYYTEVTGTEIDRRFEKLPSGPVKVPRIQVAHSAHYSLLPKGHSHTILPSPELLRETVIPAYRGTRLCFMIRDPRDVVVSHYHHLISRDQVVDEHIDADTTLGEFIRSKQYGIKKIIAYVNTWLEAKETYGQFHLLRYEDLHDDAKGQFRNLLEFLDPQQAVDESALALAIEESDFEKMKQKELSGTDELLRLKASDNKDSRKVRKGKIGGYLDELESADIGYVDEAMKKLNRDFGYQLVS
jgi:hypothetical protein